MAALLRTTWMDRIARTAFSVWIGAMITVAFLCAPLAFRAVPDMLPSKDVAARLIGPSFGRVDMLGLAVCALLGLVLLARRSEQLQGPWRLWACGSMVLAALVDLIVVSPKIISRDDPTGLYHGLATGLWMYMIVVGLLLIARGVTRPDSIDARAA